MNELKDNPKTEINQAIVTVTRSLINKLLEKLPKGLEESAKTYGAILRRRVVKSASNLILALFIYASPDMSLRMLASGAASAEIADMTDQAWQKKVVKCEPWLSHLLTEAMPKMSTKSKKAFKGKSVKLLDGSIIRQAGKLGKKGGESLRVHMCYNLTEGCMDCISVTNISTAESVTVFDIEPNTIYIADTVYGKGKALAHIRTSQADALFRATPNHLSLSDDEKGKIKINMTEILDTNVDTVDFSCYVHTENKKRIPVRVIASKLPEDKALLAKERKIRNARKEQTKNIRDETFVYAGWVILITTLPDEYSAEELLKMYRARWQIELLFKRIKQSFNVSVLPAASLTHSKAMVLLWLILWSLAEQESLGIEIFLLDSGTDMSLYSPWATQCFLFQHLMVIINCVWALSFISHSHNINALSRLLNHRSSRDNQYAIFRLLKFDSAL